MALYCSLLLNLSISFSICNLNMAWFTLQYLEMARYFSAHTPWYGSPYNPHLELPAYFHAHTPWYGSPYK